MPKGRQICLDECRFVFDRVWHVTCNHDKNDKDHVDDHVHGEKHEEILITDLYHIIHYSGILLNKKAISDESTAPFDFFKHFARKETVFDEVSGKEVPIFYVVNEDVPHILYGVFAGQEDEVRIDAG